MKIFLDDARLQDMITLQDDVDGYTTNPSLMRQHKVTNYAEFAKSLLEVLPSKPISFEVVADDVETINLQARTIAAWGDNVYVKIPVTTTDGSSLADLIYVLSDEGVKVNVTAVMNLSQIQRATDALAGGAPSIISIFAGRVADTGRDPETVMENAAKYVYPRATNIELLWASAREVFNVRQADRSGADIITLSAALLTKRNELADRDTRQYSLETVRQFHEDGKGLTL